MWRVRRRSPVFTCSTDPGTTMCSTLNQRRLRMHQMMMNLWVCRLLSVMVPSRLLTRMAAHPHLCRHRCLLLLPPPHRRLISCLPPALHLPIQAFNRRSQTRLHPLIYSSHHQLLSASLAATSMENRWLAVRIVLRRRLLLHLQP